MSRVIRQLAQEIGETRDIVKDRLMREEKFIEEAYKVLLKIIVAIGNRLVRTRFLIANKEFLNLKKDVESIQNAIDPSHKHHDRLNLCLQRMDVLKNELTTGGLSTATSEDKRRAFIISMRTILKETLFVELSEEHVIIEKILGEIEE